MKDQPQRDVVIVGAPRSGTNMLRDVLTTLEGVTTWPCDEINLVWKHGNRAEPSDELTADMARPEVQSYVRRRFDRRRRRDGAPVVVEKTCATSLRPEFARAVLPGAVFVLITRDGVDAAASAMQRWHATFDVRYTLAKARQAPPADLGWHGWRFVATQLRRRATREGGAAGGAGGISTWWGPKPRDFRELMLERPLDEICAIQWQRCIEASWRGLHGLPPEQLVTVRYEDFVARPAEEAQRLVETLGLSGTPVVGEVSARSVGRGREVLGAKTTARLEDLVGSTLEGCAVPEVVGLSLRQAAIKRTFDLVVAGGGLVVAWPLILAGWAVATLSTRHNGLFRQARIGRHGRPFEVLKLRSMREVPGAESTVTTAGDARITRTGAVLRRFKIDELPQLVNVVRGEMSLVGPRPDVPGFADLLDGEDRLVLSVRPGITGPAALAYRHEEQMLAAAPDPEKHNLEVVWPDKVRINRQYVCHWTLAGDIRCLVATVRSTTTTHRDQPADADQESLP